MGTVLEVDASNIHVIDYTETADGDLGVTFELCGPVGSAKDLVDKFFNTPNSAFANVGINIVSTENGAASLGFAALSVISALVLLVF